MTEFGILKEHKEDYEKEQHRAVIRHPVHFHV
jgi:hypothetical protein